MQDSKKKGTEASTRNELYDVRNNYVFTLRSLRRFPRKGSIWEESKNGHLKQFWHILYSFTVSVYVTRRVTELLWSFLQSVTEMGSWNVSVGLASWLLLGLPRNREFIVRRVRFAPSARRRASWRRTSCSKHVCSIWRNESFTVSEITAAVLGNKALSFRCFFFFTYFYQIT